MVAPNVENVKEGFWGFQPKSQYHQKSTQIFFKNIILSGELSDKTVKMTTGQRLSPLVSPSWHFYIIIYSL